MIQQLNNGLHPMLLPVPDLAEQLAKDALATVSWNLKVWYGLLVPERAKKLLQAFLLIPCQVVRMARRASIGCWATTPG